ncbi:MAG: lipopolysaccharide assembly protein LapA domain-containing protein [Desulfosalsimonadaceae bacterium]|nr:lipopolysaccharide assembly protein LapA domain-containing protein [Desulfosalsimonadaceae bacterium]
MRKVKFAFWLIVAVLIGLVGWDNRVFFLEEKKLTVDFFFASYSTPDLPIVLFFLGLFLAGLLIAYASGLSEKFIAKKTIRNLNSEVAAAKKKISELEGNIASLKTEAIRRETEVPVLPADAPEKAPL